MVLERMLKRGTIITGMAIEDRLKEEAALDIGYCIRSYPPGVEKLAARDDNALGISCTANQDQARMLKDQLQQEKLFG